MPEHTEDRDRLTPAAQASQPLPGPLPPAPRTRKTTTPFPTPKGAQSGSRSGSQADSQYGSLSAAPSASQSPMPGWLHWLESTAAPSSVFGPALPAPVDGASMDGSGQRSAGSAFEASDSALLHDARGMVTALELYCDLLAEPGVLAVPFQHYAGELRLIASSSRRLLEQLDQFNHPGELDKQAAQGGNRLPLPEASRKESQTKPGPRLVVSDGLPIAQRFPLREPIRSLADELMAIRNLLAALAGPAITLGLSLDGGYRAIRMAADDLTRLMVNLIRNAADAMPEGGHVQITLRELPERLHLTVTDSGCGLPEGDCEAVFAPGYTTHLDLAVGGDAEEPAHRGMGLAIVRSLVLAAGGSIRAANRPVALADAEEEVSGGAVFEMEFPLAE